MVPEHKPTWSQALKSSLRFTLGITAPAFVALGALIYWAVPQIHQEIAYTIMVATFLYLVPLLVLTRFLTLRTEETRPELEHRERMEAMRLLEKYPDLR